MIYFTADTHFWHHAILRHCPTRQEVFGDIETMNDALIDAINSRVSRHDILYHLGDFCWAASKCGSIRQQIKCRDLRVVRGNHDSSSLRKHVSSLDHMLFLKKYKMHLCHYPLADWLWEYHDGIHLHGHCHARLEKKKNRMDVGVDSAHMLFGHWGPISLEEILC